MKNFLTKNLGLKIMSLLFAFVLWLFLYNSSDPDGYLQMTIPITLVNEDVMEAKGLTYAIDDNITSVPVTIQAPLSVRSALTQSDVQVTADFSRLTAENTIALEAVCTRYRSSIDSITLGQKDLSLSVEQMVTRQLSVGINVVGTPKAGYTVVKASASPNRVTVSGPQSLMEKLETLNVNVQVDDMGTDFESTAHIQAFDKSNQSLDTSRMRLSDGDVLAKIDIEQTKTLDIQLEAKGNCASGYGLSRIELSPANINVYGDEDVMRDTEALRIPSSQLDITGATKNVEKDISVASFLPDGLYVAQEGEEVVRVVAIIEKESSRSVTVPVEDLLQVNVPAGFSVSFGSVTQVNIPLTGLDSVLKNITAKTLKPTVDLNGLSAGASQVTVQLTLPEGVEQGSSVQLQVTLTPSQ